MSDYTYDEMFRMQNEAKQRVLEMQKRSRAVVKSFSAGKSEEARSESTEPQEELPRVPRAIKYPAELPEQHARQVIQQGSRKKSTGIADIRRLFGSFFSDFTDDDYEKMLILSLCLLLTREKGDDSLILALMYLLT